MKIRILTTNAWRINPGSLLQAYALQTYLQKEGKHECEIINYWPKYFWFEGNFTKWLFKYILYFKNIKKRNKRIKEFEDKYLRLTKKYFTFQQLKNDAELADMYIVGSDNVWNEKLRCSRDEVYYLKFSNKKKMSYAASCGNSILSEDYINFLTSQINDFDRITVREETTRKTIIENGIEGVECVCDPVLLLDENKWNQFLEEKIDETVAQKIAKKKYVTVYLCEKSKELDEFIKWIKEEKGYLVVLLGGVTKRCDADIHIIDLAPDNFIYWIKHSELNISASYHCTIFSYIFKKKFVVFNSQNASERIKHFLGLIGLEERFWMKPDKGKFGSCFEDIDYKSCEKKLEKFINKSRQILDDI